MKDTAIAIVRRLREAGHTAYFAGGCVRAMLRLGIRGAHWRTMEPLLPANLTEHRVLQTLVAATAERFGGITAPVLLLGGRPIVYRVKSRAAILGKEPVRNHA